MSKGSMVAKQQKDEAEAVNMTQICEQRAQQGSGNQEEPAEWLQVGLDGGWLPSREQPGGMEGKIGVVASQLDPVGKHGRHRLRTRRSVATFASAEEVGSLTYAAAWQMHATEASQQVVLGEGAGRIKTQSEEYFPDAVKILDWSHLCCTVQAAIRALQPGKQAGRRAWRKEQYDRLLPLLWEGEREAALTYLCSLRPASADIPVAFENAVRSLRTQASWMGNYQQWREQGYPVDSGLVERAVAIVINLRMKRRGMRWKRANATSVVSLRVRRINADWNAAA